MQTFRKTVGGRECFFCFPPGYGEPGRRYPVLYSNGMETPEEEFGKIIRPAEEGFRRSEGREFVFVSVQLTDFDRDCSPWPAPAVFRGKADFTGGAGEYLEVLTREIKPFVDKEFLTLPDPAHTGLMGYSLAGLLALYGLYEAPSFGRIASLSGSLWYDGWMEYMESRTPPNQDARVHLSLGTAEEKSRNQRMARVGDCTRLAAELLKRQLPDGEVILAWNPGGHFTGVTERLGSALTWFGKSV